jgi:transposase
MAERLVEDIFTALDEQTVVVPGTDAAALIVPSLAGSLAVALDQRKLLAGRIEELLEAHPPATRSSGSSIRGEQPSRRGNKQLKRAFFLSAFAALADPVSRSYYDKKINQGKHHTQALLCLARRRADVLFAMLRDGTFYEPRPAAA